MLQGYEDDLKQAKQAKTFSEALNWERYVPKDISIQEISDLLSERLRTYILSPEQYKRIDMLFYFNRFDYGLTENQDFSFFDNALWQKWRSVSMVKNGGINFIYWANEDAPDYIKNNKRKIILNHK